MDFQKLSKIELFEFCINNGINSSLKLTRKEMLNKIKLYYDNDYEEKFDINNVLYEYICPNKTGYYKLIKLQNICKELGVKKIKKSLNACVKDVIKNSIQVKDCISERFLDYYMDKDTKTCIFLLRNKRNELKFNLISDNIFSLFKSDLFKKFYNKEIIKEIIKEKNLHYNYVRHFINFLNENDEDIVDLLIMNYNFFVMCCHEYFESEKKYWIENEDRVNVFYDYCLSLCLDLNNNYICFYFIKEFLLKYNEMILKETYETIIRKTNNYELNYWLYKNSWIDLSDLELRMENNENLKNYIICRNQKEFKKSAKK